MNSLFVRLAAMLLLTVIVSVGMTLLVISATIGHVLADELPAFNVRREPPPMEAPRAPAGAQSRETVSLVQSGGDLKIVWPLPDAERWLWIGPLGGGPPAIVPRLFLALSLLVALSVALLISRPVTRQLKMLHEATARLERGDMSARAKVVARNELGELAEAFNQMASRRQADIGEREVLLQAVAHELGAPLSRMHFGLDFLRKATSDAAREEQMASIEEELVALDLLASELVAWVESASPLYAKHGPAQGDAAAVVRASLSRTARYSSRSGDLIAVQTGPLTIDHPQDLQRVLDNLLRNAERYARLKVVAEVRRSGREVVIEVRDDGPGIALAHRARVFEPFARLDAARDRQYGGVGLGLAIVARLVTRAGGTVSIGDAPEGGAAFVVTWPLAPDAAP